MSNIKSSRILLPIWTVVVLGASYALQNRSSLDTSPDPIPTSTTQDVKEANSSLKIKRIALLPATSIADQQGNPLSDNSPIRQKSKYLPGLFRGDWGATPVYAKNDRVNYERGAYLSLVEENQNQPPATSPGYWQLVHKFKALHEENCFSPAPGLDMGECDFTEGGSLRGKDLRDAVLTKARLNGELGTADLSGANLSGATVIGALVISPDTRLDHADLSHLQSDGNNPVIAESANLQGVNFTKASLYGARLQYADLTDAKLPEAVLTGAQLSYAHFDNANLDKTDMAYSNLSASSLLNAAMTESNLEQADLSRADLSNANLQKANFSGSQLAGANFSGADLRGVNFSAAQGGNTAIVDNETDFTAAICPDGVTVDGTQVTTCIGHGF
ncbi:MAG: pentapeptide repeat-containing protein [Methylococcaceae bacterium]|nr:pentapeptide repeat-containing protein [Methylococcaceae bacterium]